MRIFPSNATDFTGNGLGRLTDSVYAMVTEELNGQYELEIRYPMSGIHSTEIADRVIITAKPDAQSDEQPFRVYRITKPINGVFTVYARHIAYDMKGIPISPFEASTLGTTLQMLPQKAAVTCPFSISTDKSVSTGYRLATPKSLWSILGGSEGSILSAYHGEWLFDKYVATLCNRRGQNRGVSIRYGKNMTNFEQDANCENVFTGVYPYWNNPNGEGLVELPEKIVNAAGTFNFTRVLTVDMSSDFQDPPTEAQLRARAQAYINDNKIGLPDVNWTVEFVMLDQCEEYKDKTLLERISLGDDVNVHFAQYDVDVTARAVAIKFNVLLNRYEEVSLGSVKANMADTIALHQKEIEAKPSKTIVNTIVEQLTKEILGALGGAVRLLDTNGDGMPDELYIADNEDPALATKVWRWNYQGWAASANGYTGPFTMGATLENGILANAITAGQIRAGSIISADGTSFYLNLDENVLRMSGIDSRFATESANTDAKIADATDGISDHIDEVESSLTEKLIPLTELSDYIQVGNIGTESTPLFGVKIGKRDLLTAFKSVFTASALEFYENEVRTAFLSNQKLNTNTIRTAAMELVSSANMADPSSVDWLVTLDNGYTIKYVGGGS